jgi:hypothetical protein
MTQIEEEFIGTPTVLDLVRIIAILERLGIGPVYVEIKTYQKIKIFSGFITTQKTQDNILEIIWALTRTSEFTRILIENHKSKSARFVASK